MARLPRLPAALLLALAACAGARQATVAPPPPRPPDPGPPPDPVAPVRAEVDSLLAAQGEILWRTWTRGEQGDPAAAFEGRERILSPASLALVRGAARGARGDERRALDLLSGFLAGEQLGRAAAPSAGKLAASRAQSVLAWEGREISAGKVPALLAQEADPDRRVRIEAALARAEQRRAPLAEAHRQALDHAARAMGGGGLLALAATLRGATPEALAARARAALDATDSTFRALMEALSRRELGNPLEELRGRDLPRLFFLAQEARAFPAGSAAERALATLRALGMDLAGREGVVLDLGARQGKDPRPILVPVAVPGSVRVSVAAEGGQAEARAVLRAMGGAALHAWTASPVLEFRRLGGVTADAWAGVFEELAGDPHWLAEQTGLGDHQLEPVVRAGAARRLLALREAAARLLLELSRTGDPGRDGEEARALCARAFARPVEAAEASLFALEPDPLLRSADVLASMMLAAQAEASLARAGGPSWWRSPEAGAALRAALAEGARLDPEALARSLGFERIDAGAIAAISRARGERAGVRF